MKIVIIEDEKPAQEKIASFLKDFNASDQIIAVLESVKDSVKWFSQNPMPDLIFSDIELLDGNIFKLFDLFHITSPIIFITAYDHFLLKAFDTNGIAYLLKPFQYYQFVNAIKKHEKLKIMFTHQMLQNLSHSLNFDCKQFKQRFIIKKRGGILLLDVDQITYIQIRNGVCFAYNVKNEHFPLVENLNELEEVLDPSKFFRINRQEIVQISFIEKIFPGQNDSLHIKLKEVNAGFHCSLNKVPEFRKWLDR